jgi:hypothetical protein
MTRIHRPLARIAAASAAAALALTLLAGCAGAARDAATVSNGAYGGAPAAQPAPGALQDQSMAGGAEAAKSAAPAAAREAAGVARMVVRDRTLRLEVAKTAAAVEALRAIATKNGGWVADLRIASESQPVYREPMPATEGGVASSSGSSVPLAGYVTLRVPSARFEAAAKQAAALGKVVYESEGAQDVTQQYVDLAARIDNLKATEAGLRRLFAKARTVPEMLAIQKQLTEVQGEIESLTAQKQVLEKQAAFATLTVELAQPAAIVRPPGVDWGIASAVTESIQGFVGVFRLAIVAVGPLLAVAIVLGLVGLAVWGVIVLILRIAASRTPRVDDGGAIADDDDDETPSEGE